MAQHVSLKTSHIHIFCQLVLFSDSLHLGARDDASRDEWIRFLQLVVPRTQYDQSDPLQVASLEKEVESFDTLFHSESSPGILLERRGNWAIAALVSESLSRKVCRGSLLSSISGEPAIMMGFDEVVKALSNWTAPLQLSFQLSPRKMGWLNLMVKERGRQRLKGRLSSNESWEKVYATLSSGVMTLFVVIKTGKSKKRQFGLSGSAIGLVASNLVNGSKSCFRVLDGVETITLQADSQEMQMEWSTAIAHSISMENGGGIIMEKEKLAMAQDGRGLDSFGFPLPGIGPPVYDSSIFRRAFKAEDATTTSIVFAKPIQDLCLGSSESDDIGLEPITDRRRPIKAQEVIGTTLNNLNLVDMPMMHYHRSNKSVYPVQALRAEESNPWMSIDRALSESSGSDIFDEVSNTHGNYITTTEDFSKLVQFTKDVSVVRM